MPILCPHPDLVSQKLWGDGSSKLQFNKPLGDSDACPCLRSTARLRKHLRPCESPLEFLVPRPMSTRVEVNYDEQYQGPTANGVLVQQPPRRCRTSTEQSAFMRKLGTLELFKSHIRPSHFEYRNNTTPWRESGLS